MWKLEREDVHFKIYDERKLLVGYFGPEYGQIEPEDRAAQVIEEMHKRQEKIAGGYLLLPLVKFGIFEEGSEMDMDYVVQKLEAVAYTLSVWRQLMQEKSLGRHKIIVSHTDHDMLSITLYLGFATPIPLEKNALGQEIGKLLDVIHQKGLL
jgi:hypothetical protein